MKDKFDGKEQPIRNVKSFNIDIPEDITDEIDRTLFEIDKYILGTRPEQQIDAENTILSDRKKKILSKISKWKYSFR